MRLCDVYYSNKLRINKLVRFSAQKRLEKKQRDQAVNRIASLERENAEIKKKTMGETIKPIEYEKVTFESKLNEL